MYKKLLNQELFGKQVIIGFFDVIHKGHIKLFEAVDKKNACIITFFEIPRKVPINNLLVRLEQLKELGFDEVYLYDIKQNNLTAKEFVDKYLKNAKEIVVGSDFIFGSDFKSIKCFVNDINLKLIKYDEHYSTTRIKELLSKGEIDKVNRLLYKPYNVANNVVKGDMLGRTIGFKTANFNFDRELFLQEGVYLTKTIIKNNIYKSLTIYGRPNSIKNTEFPLMETHILNFNKNIYGAKINVVFFQRIANIIRFNSKQELIDKIKEYVDICKRTKY